MEDKTVWIVAGVGALAVFALSRGSSGGASIRTIAPLPAASDPNAQAQLGAETSAFNTLANVYARITTGAQSAAVSVAQTQAAQDIENRRTAAQLQSAQIAADAQKYAVHNQQQTQRRKDVLSTIADVGKAALAFVGSIL